MLSYPRIAKRLKLTEGEMAMILTTLLSKAAVTPGHLQLPGVTRDPKDDAVVACAKEGEADYIISGDQDPLILESRVARNALLVHIDEKRPKKL